MLFVDIKKQLSHFKLQVNFSVKNDEIVVLHGPSGSGKTTILNGIAGIISLDEGEIRLAGEALYRQGKQLVPIQQRNIGYVFQEGALFPHKTVWENIVYGMRNKTFAHSLIEELAISHLKDKFPKEISGGEKQRVAFVRALVTEPKLLLLDEPFSALDDEMRKIALHILYRVQSQSQIPVVFITHQVDEHHIIPTRRIHIQKGKHLVK